MLKLYLLAFNLCVNMMEWGTFLLSCKGKATVKKQAKIISKVV